MAADTEFFPTLVSGTLGGGACVYGIINRVQVSFDLRNFLRRTLPPPRPLRNQPRYPKMSNIQSKFRCRDPS